MAKKEYDVTSFGETMIRLSVPIGNRLENSTQLDFRTAGTESNVLSLVSRLGKSTMFVTKLPNSNLGKKIANDILVSGVDISSIVWVDEGRVGTYFVEFSSPPRPTKVIYDRKDSAVSKTEISDINWKKMLSTEIILATGITPALSANCKSLLKEIFSRAKQNEVAIIFDVNYREMLWSVDEAAKELLPFLQESDLLICKKSDAEKLFLLKGEPEEIINQLQKLTNVKTIVLTIGEEGVIALYNGNIYHQPARKVAIIDRLGAGDAMTAGVIIGWLENDIQLGLKYGSTLSAIALSQHGDMVVTTREELETIIDAKSTDVSR